MTTSNVLRSMTVAAAQLAAALLGSCSRSATGAHADGTTHEETAPMKPGANNPGGPPPPPGVHGGRAVAVIVMDGEIFLHQLYGGVQAQVLAGMPADEVTAGLEALRAQYEPLLVSVGRERDGLGPDPRAEFDASWTRSVTVATERFLAGDDYVAGRDRLVAEDPAVGELIDALAGMHALVKLDELRANDPETAKRLGAN